MKKYDIKLLVLGDQDMNCDVKTLTIDKMSLDDIGFSMLAIKDYDMIIYDGLKGTKILKSRYTKKGKVI